MADLTAAQRAEQARRKIAGLETKQPLLKGTRGTDINAIDASVPPVGPVQIAAPVQALSPSAQYAADWNKSHVFMNPNRNVPPPGQAFQQVGPDVSDSTYSSAIQRQGKTPLQISQEADAATYAMARQAGANSYARGQLTSDMDQADVEKAFPRADVQMKPEGWVFGGPGGSVQQNGVPSRVSSAPAALNPSPAALNPSPIVATLPPVRTPFNRTMWQGGALSTTPVVPVGMRTDPLAAPVVRDFRGNPLPESINWTKNAPVQFIPQVTPWRQRTPGVNYGIKKSPGYDFSGAKVTPVSTPLTPISTKTPKWNWWTGLKQSMFSHRK